MKATHTIKIGDKYYYAGEELPEKEDEMPKRKKTTKSTEKKE
ncbi:MAG: hypothetical protein ACLRVU_01245 [Beduini sp.]